MRLTLVTLLSGLGMLLIGSGLLGTLLGVRASLESFDNIRIGLIMAGYYTGYVLGTSVGPTVVSRVGHIRAFSAFSALTAATMLALGLWVNPWAWLVLRLFNGIGIVGVYIVVESWLNAQTPNALRGRVFATYMISTLLALGAGQYLLLAYDPRGLELFALATILTTLGLIPIAAVRIKEPKIEAPTRLSLGTLYTLSPLGTVGAFAAGLASGTFWGMTPVFAQRLNMTTGEIAVLMSATIAGGAVLQYPVGHLSDLIDRRRVLVAASFAGGGLSVLMAYIVVGALPGLAVVSFFYGGLLFSLYSLSIAHTNDHLDSAQTLSATRGLLLTFGLGALIGPLLAGMAMEWAGPEALPVVSALACFGLGVFGLERMLQRAPPSAEAQGDFVPLIRTTPMALELHPEVVTDPPTAHGKPAD